jgi:hypothetical protein
VNEYWLVAIILLLKIPPDAAFSTAWQCLPLHAGKLAKVHHPGSRLQKGNGILEIVAVKVIGTKGKDDDFHHSYIKFRSLFLAGIFLEGCF